MVISWLSHGQPPMAGTVPVYITTKRPPGWPGHKGVPPMLPLGHWAGTSAVLVFCLTWNFYLINHNIYRHYDRHYNRIIPDHWQPKHRRLIDG